MRSRHWHSPKRGAHTAEPSRPAAAPQRVAGRGRRAGRARRPRRAGRCRLNPPPFRVSSCYRPSLQAVDAGHGRREGGGVDPGAVRRQQAHRLQVAAGSRRPGFSRAHGGRARRGKVDDGLNGRTRPGRGDGGGAWANDGGGSVGGQGDGRVGQRRRRAEVGVGVGVGAKGARG